MNEFELIQRHFVTPNTLGAGAMRAPHVLLGPGDDCALIQHTAGLAQAVSSDMLVAGRHFFEDTDPASLGHKALAVNLSDLAAMGAKPRSFTLALALPTVDDAWVGAFSRGLLRLADTHQCALIGGDITRGPLSIAITVMGDVPLAEALRRDGAQAGDDIYVSGTLGDAALALSWALDDPRTAAAKATLSATDRAAVVERMTAPTPRVALGLALRGVASAAMDVSDGIAGDLRHLLAASRCGATIQVDALPVSAAVRDLPIEVRRQFAFAGGDDYELLFTAPPTAAPHLQALCPKLGVKITRIGQILADTTLTLLDANGQSVTHSYRGFDHFPS